MIITSIFLSLLTFLLCNRSNSTHVSDRTIGSLVSTLTVSFVRDHFRIFRLEVTDARIRIPLQSIDDPLVLALFDLELLLSDPVELSEVVLGLVMLGELVVPWELLVRVLLVHDKNQHHD